MTYDYKDLLSQLKDILSDDDIKINEPMRKHTTFKIGGPCDIMIYPTNEEQLLNSIRVIIKIGIPYFVLGSGSNLLVRDGGIRGVVINLSKFKNVLVCEDVIKAQAGASLFDISRIARDNSLDGFSFACGIPGTIGGAINMNAGAYGGEMSQVIESVRVIDRNGNISYIENKDMDFGYRHTVIMDKRYLIVDCNIKLKYGDKEKIDNEIKDLMYRRNSKQPLECPSAGSVFKRPEGYFAGKLIEDSGLRGYTHKNVKISDKHCGFIVSVNDNATAKEVLELIDIVRSKVYNKFKVNLEMEVRVVGED